VDDLRLGAAIGQFDIDAPKEGVRTAAGGRERAGIL
jgi:hypothetical protein